MLETAPGNPGKRPEMYTGTGGKHKRRAVLPFTKERIEQPKTAGRNLTICPVNGMPDEQHRTPDISASPKGTNVNR